MLNEEIIEKNKAQHELYCYVFDKLVTNNMVCSNFHILNTWQRPLVITRGGLHYIDNQKQLEYAK